MSDESNPVVVVEMDRPRQLKYPLSVQAKIERMVHKEDALTAKEAGMQVPPRMVPISQIINDRFNFSVNRFKILLYNGLLFDDPKLKPEDLDRIYDAYRQNFEATEEEGAYLHMFKKMAEAINIDLGPPLPKKEEKPPDSPSPGN